MNPNISLLQPYPFEKLARLKANIQPPSHLEHIALSIGEPQHPAPDFVTNCLIAHKQKLAKYPTTQGLPELRKAVASWCIKRFKLPPNSLNIQEQVLPVNGTREAIFAFTQAAIKPSADALVVMPNPFYQIYEGAAYLAGAKPYYLNCLPENNFIPDYDSVPEKVWQSCQLLFICSPSNPTGAVTSLDSLKKLIELSDKYNFIIASDECYSEIYFDENSAPVGLLQACAELGRHDFKNCVVMHSLSKRSNLPGMRSGFIAGDAALLVPFLSYRTYHGCAMPIQHQMASIAAWSDETHVQANRNLYRQKFDSFIQILEPFIYISRPDASFYLWLKTPVADDIFARELFARQNITVLPGRYLSREEQQQLPGSGYVRIALVASLESCIEAATRIRCFIEPLLEE